MTRTKELIIFSFFFALGLLFTFNVIKANAQEQVKCYGNAEFMKVIEEKSLSTIYNGLKSDKEVQEVMLSANRDIYIIEYQKSPDNNALNAKSYCIVGVLNNVTFNEDAIEFLYKLLEKMRGQKT